MEKSRQASHSFALLSFALLSSKNVPSGSVLFTSEGHFEIVDSEELNALIASDREKSEPNRRNDA
jgi:hypothetical protein